MTTAQPIPFIGLTGAIAAGKSEALSALGRAGAATLSSDAVVHELLDTDPVRDLLVDRWGAAVAPRGSTDRSAVAARVFADPAELAWLERTLHPLVGERIAAWRQGLDPETRLAVVEVPLLFETEMERAFDATITVVAPDDLRAERAGLRGTRELDERAGRQLSQAEKARRASFVVHNGDGLEELDHAVRELVATIAAMPHEGG